MRAARSIAGLMMILGSSLSQAQQNDAAILVALSDTDMVPTVYETGELGPVAAIPDALSVVTSPGVGERQIRHYGVSNSNGGPPGALVVSRDGQYAFVAETLRRRTAGATRLADLQPGRMLRSVRLNDGTIIDEVEVGRQPQSVHLDSQGALLLVASLEPDGELAFIPVHNGRFGSVVRFGLDLPPSSGLVPIKSTWAQWHPREEAIAVNLVDRAQVAFYRVTRNGSGAVSGIRPWGNRVQTNKFPFTGRFSPDGRYYITADLQWGPDTEGFFGVHEGILTTIRVADTIDDAGPRHTVPHVALAGWNAETIMFSPDGRYLVTSNLRGTGKPAGSPDFTEAASLSLYAMDSHSGRLELLDEKNFDAVLPQGLAFVPGGRQLYVGVNSYRNGIPEMGSIELWHIRDGPKATLERSQERIPLTVGVHTLAIAVANPR